LFYRIRQNEADRILLEGVFMKIKLLWGVVVVAVAVLAGCAGAPAPVEPEAPPAAPAAPAPAAAPVDPDAAAPGSAALGALNDAADRAARARALVRDFDGEGYFPSDWTDADGLYTQAESGRASATVREARESTARYTAAADALEALAGKTIPRYATDLADEVYNTRAGAVAAGAGTLAPDYLLQTDNKAVEALTAYEAGDYYPARDAALAARDRYGAVETGVYAYTIRLELEERGFVRYDSSAIASTDTAALSGLGAWDAGDIAAAAATAADVLARYDRSLARAKQSYATDSAAGAAAARQRALDVKANVAVRQDYDAAEGIYNRAVAYFRETLYDNAADQYVEALVKYDMVTQTAWDKRQTAEAALQAAELKMVESDGNARQAEMLINEGVIQ
jgi:hypothetical protein